MRQPGPLCTASAWQDSSFTRPPAWRPRAGSRGAGVSGSPGPDRLRPRTRPVRARHQAWFAVTEQRRAEVGYILRAVCAWAADHVDVRGVVLVGSWARDAAHAESDVDIVVLTDTAGHADAEVWTLLLDGPVIAERQWGPVREVRVRRASGLEVELDIAPLSWAGSHPVDPGTYRVMRDGHRIAHDPGDVLAALSAACRAAR
ncbi:MAG: nucleotidyltransferase domain-containing protein [Micromonosporaceae bacterium]|nr:nucleotidyltransferase domain-containing protein [Micromonosporaceae bacterium]